MIVFRGENGKYRTSSLFYERWLLVPVDKQHIHLPVFSIHSDREGLINARKTFLEYGDPTGYKWATEHLDGWQHWLTLMDSIWFREAYDLWLSELKAQMTANALAKVEAISKSQSPAAFQAAKYLANKEWEKPRKGRPSKETMAGELKNAIRNIDSEEDDFKRVTQFRVVK